MVQGSFGKDSWLSVGSHRAGPSPTPPAPGRDGTQRKSTFQGAVLGRGQERPSFRKLWKQEGGSPLPTDSAAGGPPGLGTE